MKLDVLAGGDRVHGASIFAVRRDGTLAFSTVEPGAFGSAQFLFIREFFHLDFSCGNRKRRCLLRPEMRPTQTGAFCKKTITRVSSIRTVIRVGWSLTSCRVSELRTKNKFEYLVNEILEGAKRWLKCVSFLAFIMHKWLASLSKDLDGMRRGGRLSRYLDWSIDLGFHRCVDVNGPVGSSDGNDKRITGLFFVRLVGTIVFPPSTDWIDADRRSLG